MFRKTISTALAALLLATAGARAADTARISGHDGLVWADVDCAGTTLHFVVDTGAACSCVNLKAARRLGLPLGAALNVAGVGGGTTGYRCDAFQASVGGMRLPEHVVALDLSGPARACSQPIDGLIGADFFRGKVVRIDYAQGLLQRIESSPDTGTPLRFAANGVICVPVAVNGSAPRWTRLDTGCTDALDWCETAGSRAKGAGKSVALAWSGQSALQADVTVGATRLQNVPIKLHNREMFPGEAGLLGNATLSNYRVTIDGIHHRLMLQPSYVAGAL